jgi:hypothetical protein
MMHMGQSVYNQSLTPRAPSHNPTLEVNTRPLCVALSLDLSLQPIASKCYDKVDPTIGLSLVHA